MATGIFASIGATGLLYGNPYQAVIQLTAVAVTWVYAFTVTFALAKLLNAAIGLRVEAEEEEVGLDISQHGETAYS